jgi:hypothetical protein
MQICMHAGDANKRYNVHWHGYDSTLYVSIYTDSTVTTLEIEKCSCSYLFPSSLYFISLSLQLLYFYSGFYSREKRRVLWGVEWFISFPKKSPSNFFLYIWVISNRRLEIPFSLTSLFPFRLRMRYIHCTYILRVTRAKLMERTTIWFNFYSSASVWGKRGRRRVGLHFRLDSKRRKCPTHGLPSTTISTHHVHSGRFPNPGIPIQSFKVLNTSAKSLTLPQSQININFLNI